jgi:hypothetical protein
VVLLVKVYQKSQVNQELEGGEKGEGECGQEGEGEGGKEA